MPTLEPHLYIDLGSDYAGWKDITADVLIDNPVRWVQGITSNDPRDRIANTGQFVIELDNSSDNSAGVAGYYSPGHSDCLAGFDIGRRIRWQYESPTDQDLSAIFAATSPDTDLFDTDLQITYSDNIQKTDNTFYDGLYYPVITASDQLIRWDGESALAETIDNDNITLSFWAKMTSDNSTHEFPDINFQLWSSDQVTRDYTWIMFSATSTDQTTYPYLIRSSTDATATTTIQLLYSCDNLWGSYNTWHHFAATVDSANSALTLYVDGKPTSETLTSDGLSSLGLGSGKYISIVAGRHAGSMAHIAVWNKVLTSDEIFAITQLGEFSFDAHIAVAHEAPIIYYPLGAKTAITAATPYYEQNRAIKYTWAQLEAGYQSALPRYAFAGRISNIDVPVGRFGERKVVIEAVDWMDDASNVLVADVPTMVNYTAYQIISMFLLYSGVNPTTYNFDVGQTLSYAWGSSKGNETLYSELKRIAQSEPGYIYMRGCAASDGEVGGVLQFEAKSARFEKTTTDAAFGDDVASDAPYDIRATRSLDRLVNGVEVTVHPVEIDTVAVSVYTMSTDLTPTIPAYGELVFTAKYVDTDEAYELIGATEITQPVRNVDYTINSRADGLGNDTTEDVRAVISSIESANLIQYLIGYEQNGYVLANYKKPSVPATTSVPVNTTGGTTTVTTIGTIINPYNPQPPRLAT